MAENDTTDAPDAPVTNGEATPEAKPAQPVQVTNRIIAQYVRDMSFENILAQKGVTGDPAADIQARVDVDARKRGGDDQFEVITKLNITSKTRDKGEMLFVLEIDYAGVFQIKGVPDEQMGPYLMIECPRLVFPYIRKLVADMTREGGFQSLSLDQFDYVALYRAKLAAQIEAQKRAQADQPLN
ncbi:protein translocase subunit secB [Loktanella fryxellensis]|uniref:Protein translocase subunit secB n=1 Tax=Loktanella fryxellensis TaxID=245187 RepID=A0A1H8DZC6_9RHOB|nr:protein-export chaperone SecB [Loktanella fryxellensis]SEN11888.1 protein translocase subunit secB [Loktanella fryxellensis]